MDREITQILSAYGAGDAKAENQLFNLVYNQLKLIARNRLGSHKNPTMNTTMLVNEAYMKLFDSPSKDWSNRKHFYAVAATAMRHIIIDHARSRLANKRKADASDEDVESVQADIRHADQMLAINEAIESLKKTQADAAQVFECRYFVGLSTKETSEALEKPIRTVERLWSTAKAYLKNQLS